MCSVSPNSHTRERESAYVDVDPLTGEQRGFEADSRVRRVSISFPAIKRHVLPPLCSPPSLPSPNEEQEAFPIQTSCPSLESRKVEMYSLGERDSTLSPPMSCPGSTSGSFWSHYSLASRRRRSSQLVEKLAREDSETGDPRLVGRKGILKSASHSTDSLAAPALPLTRPQLNRWHSNTSYTPASPPTHPELAPTLPLAPCCDRCHLAAEYGLSYPLPPPDFSPGARKKLELDHSSEPGHIAGLLVKSLAAVGAGTEEVVGELNCKGTGLMLVRVDTEGEGKDGSVQVDEVPQFGIIEGGEEEKTAEERRNEKEISLMGMSLDDSNLVPPPP